MKWKLGLLRCYLCSILFGDTMVSNNIAFRAYNGESHGKENGK